MRCAMRADYTMTFKWVCKTLNDDLIKEIVLQCVSTIDQVYLLVQDYKLVIKK
jgi:hypothetical protein